MSGKETNQPEPVEEKKTKKQKNKAKENVWNHSTTNFNIHFLSSAPVHTVGRYRYATETTRIAEFWLNWTIPYRTGISQTDPLIEKPYLPLFYGTDMK